MKSFWVIILEAEGETERIVASAARRPGIPTERRRWCPNASGIDARVLRPEDAEVAGGERGRERAAAHEPSTTTAPAP